MGLCANLYQFKLLDCLLIKLLKCYTDKMNLANVANDRQCPQARAWLYNHHLLL